MNEGVRERPLLGRRVIVTRAARQAGGLVQRLRAEGADVLSFPCLEFVAATSEQQGALERALTDDRERFAGIIVSSPNGADALCSALARAQLDARVFARKHIVAIGKGTAERLVTGGLRADIIPKHARSEGLIAALRERALLGVTWLQIRADEGRALLGEVITAAGGVLEVVVGYGTVRPSPSPELLAALLASDDGDHDGPAYDAICFASGRTARHFLETTTEALGEARARAQLARAKVITIGPVTADAITALGVRVDAMAEQRSEAGLVDAVLRACSDPSTLLQHP